MSFHRIWGVVLRYLYLFKRSLDRQTDAFYWPAVDLIIWGLTSTYFSSQSSNALQAVTIVASGIVLWIVVWRGQYEVTVNILEEMWNKNMINMFVSPLQISEWIAGFVILSIIKAAVSLAFAAFLAFLLYHVNLYVHAFSLLPYLVLLILTGWWVGFAIGALIMRFGGKVQQFAWSLVFLIAPFSAIYYPLAILPIWMQKVAAFIPTSYLFEGARGVILTGRIDGHKLLIALALNAVYLAVSIWLFRKSFNYVLSKGLVKFY